MRYKSILLTILGLVLVPCIIHAETPSAKFKVEYIRGDSISLQSTSLDDGEIISYAWTIKEHGEVKRTAINKPSIQYDMDDDTAWIKLEVADDEQLSDQYIKVISLKKIIKRAYKKRGKGRKRNQNIRRRR